MVDIAVVVVVIFGRPGRGPGNGLLKNCAHVLLALYGGALLHASKNNLAPTHYIYIGYYYNTFY